MACVASIESIYPLCLLLYRGKKSLGQSSVNLDYIFSKLIPISHKWKQLAKVIGIDEDLVDEIFTKNERDKECLRSVLKEWVKKSPTWRTVIDSLQKIDEDQLAESLSHSCKTHCFLH